MFYRYLNREIKFNEALRLESDWSWLCYVCVSETLVTILLKS